MPLHQEERHAGPGELAMFAFACLALALAGMAMPRIPGLPPTWFSAPAITAFLVLRASGSWGPILATALAANLAAALTAGIPLPNAAAWLPAGLFEATAGALLARRFGPVDNWLEVPHKFGRFLLVIAGLAPLASAAYGGLASHWGNWPQAAVTGLHWYLYAAVAQASLLPVMVLALQRGLPGLARSLPLRQALPAALVLGVAVAGVLLLHVPSPFALVAVALLVGALMLQFEVAVLMLMEAGLLSLLALPTMLGNRYVYLSGLDGEWTAANFLARLLTTLVLTMMAASAVERTRRREHAFRQSEGSVRALSERLAMATHAGKIGYWNVDLVRRVNEWDEQMCEFYWLPPSPGVTDEMWQSRVHPEDLPLLVAEFRAALKDGGHGRAEFRIRGPLGQERTLQIVYTVQRNPAGRAENVVGLCWDISREKEYEAAIARNTRELQTIIDHFPGMVGYWDTELRNRFANRAYRDWFGLDNEKLRGQHISEVLGAERYALNLPYIQGALSGKPQLFERTIVDPQGVTRFSLANYQPDIVDGRVRGFFAFVSDITPVRHAQQAQNEAQNMLKSIIDAASEFCIIAMTRDGTVRLFSVGAEQLLGYHADEIVDQQSCALFHDTTELDAAGREAGARAGRPMSGLEAIFDVVTKGGIDAREWTYIRKNGSRVPVSLVVSGLRNARGELDGFLAIARDITARRAADSDLREATMAAHAASQAKSEFVANMSHELRTPMNAVLGLAHLLGNTAMTAEQRRYVEMIRSSGESLMGILNDILDFSKIEAGRMDVAPLPFSLDDVLDHLSNIMSVAAGERAVALCIDVAPDTPRMFVGDAMRLQQVLVNLASNAIKFTEQGEIVLSVHCQHDAVGATLHFDMSDSGIGMTEAQKARLFLPFSQGDSSVTRRFGGTGLGLAITGRLLQMMGGTISIDSAPGLGSSFKVVLPVGLGVEALSAPPQACRLLVLDRHPATLSSIAHHAAALGWQTIPAPTPEEAAVQLARADVLLADWRLLEAGGAPLYDMLAQAQQRDLPVVAMANAYGRDHLMRSEAAAHLAGSLQMPVTRRMLHDVVLQVLASEPAARSGISRPADEQRCDGAHVLVVEDNHLNQLVARLTLEQSGATVTLADNGQQAIDLLRANPEGFDVVLMDVQMPVKDGYTATREIRQDLALDIPIVAMTAGVLEAERQQCLASGMNDFLSKPLVLPELYGLVRRYRRNGSEGPRASAPAPTAVVPAMHVMPATAATPATPQKAGLFDPGALLELGAGNADFIASVRDLVQQMLDGGLAAVDEARRAWESGDGAAARRHMHTMRGSIGTLGARRMHEASLALELALGNENREAIEAAFAKAEEVRSATIAAARAWQEAQAERSS